MKINFSKFLWIFPFFMFIFGYYLLHVFLQRKDVFVPNVIGKNIQAAMNVLSEKNLSIRLLREQEDPDLPEGIILDQFPKADYKVKPNQHLFLVVSKKPKPILAPDFLGQSQKDIVKLASKLGVQVETFWVNSIYAINSCLAQYPSSDQMVNNRKILAYFSSGSKNLYVVPDLRGYKVDLIKDALKSENINLEVFHTNPVEQAHH